MKSKMEDVYNQSEKVCVCSFYMNFVPPIIFVVMSLPLHYNDPWVDNPNAL